MTFGELRSAYEFHQTTAWDHTAMICCQLVQALTGERRMPRDFNPYRVAAFERARKAGAKQRLYAWMNHVDQSNGKA